MWEIIMIAIGVAMDAFAVSVCKGLSAPKLSPLHMLITGFYFGTFQALMPTAGYLLGARFSQYIAAIDHWIAFGLLSLIGFGMILESEKKSEKLTAVFTPYVMIPLAVSTSIDALAVGVTFAIADTDILRAIPIIGAVAFLLSSFGIAVGYRFGIKIKAKAELFGGFVLIFMGVKILLEHLGILCI